MMLDKRYVNQANVLFTNKQQSEMDASKAEIAPLGSDTFNRQNF